MQIQTSPQANPHRIPQGMRIQSNGEPRKDSFEPGELRERIEAAAFGAILLGGGAALGHAYGTSGCWGAAGLAGVSGFVLTSSPRIEIEGTLFASGLMAAIAGGCGAGGQAMGPGFIAAAAAVGGALGYIAGGRSDS